MKITTTEKEDVIHGITFRFYNLEDVPQHFPDIAGLSAKACRSIVEKTQSDRISFVEYVDGEWQETVYERRSYDFHYPDYDGVEAIVQQRVWQRAS